MKDFCLSILNNHHDKSTNLSAVECRDTKDIEVEVFSRNSFQKEVFDIIRTIESCYQETQEQGSNGNSSTFWPWWLKSFGK